MAPTEESKERLQGQVELWNQALSYIKSVALALALDLRVADAIHRHGGSATLSQIASAIPVHPCKVPGLRRLMRVLTTAGTFTVQRQPAATSSGGGRRDDDAVYELTPASRLLVNDDGESYVSLMLSNVQTLPLVVGHAAWFRQDELEPCPFALAHGKSFWEMTGREAAFVLFDNAMATDSRSLMQIVLKECSEVFHGIDSLVDVGGGHGGAATAIAAAFPSLKCSVLDLPYVVAQAPADSSVQFVAGDMFQSIPMANAVFLKLILHDWRDDECVMILKNCKQAIPSRDAGGKVIIIDMVVGSGSSDNKHLETQVFHDLLILSINGMERDEQQWKKIFFEAGFKEYKIVSILGIRSIIELYP